MFDQGIGVCSVRLSRLASTGRPAYGNANGAVVICASTSVLTTNWETEAGVEQFVRDACGVVVTNRKKPDTVKYCTWELTLLRSDYRIPEIMELGSLLGPAGAPVGIAWFSSRRCATVARNGFFMEAWQERVNCDVASTPPYRRIVISQSFAVPGEEQRNEDPQESTFQGYGQTNANMADGPFNDLDVITDPTAGPMFEIDADATPNCPDPFTYVPLPADLST